MFEQYCLRNKKTTFLASGKGKIPSKPEQVYAAILGSSENNDLFQNRQSYSHRILEIPRNLLAMVSVRLQMLCIRVKSRQAKIGGTCYGLLPVVRKL